MFQIEPVLWLQSLESPAMTWIMSSITLLGYTPVYATLLIILIFGVRLKLGLYVFLALVINGILTDGLKRGLTFPRPSDVDSRVIEPGFVRGPLLVERGGAKTFWTFPSDEAMAATKIQIDWSYGFPSGHVSGAAVFFLALAFFFRSRGVLVFSVFWIFLMALSRMYLGRHFIADVLGGVGVGVFALALAIFLVRPLMKENAKEKNYWDLLRWVFFVISLVVLAPFIEILDKENIGRLLGLLVTYVLLFRIGFPADGGKLWKRITRILIAVVAYMILDPLMDTLSDAMGFHDNSFGMLIIVFLLTFVPFFLTILIAMRIKLFDTQKQLIS